MNNEQIKQEFKKAQSLVVRSAYFKQYMQKVSKEIGTTNIDQILAHIYQAYEIKKQGQNEYYNLAVYLDHEIEKVAA